MEITSKKICCNRHERPPIHAFNNNLVRITPNFTKILEMNLKLLFKTNKNIQINKIIPPLLGRLMYLMNDANPKLNLTNQHHDNPTLNDKVNSKHLNQTNLKLNKILNQQIKITDTTSPHDVRHRKLHDDEVYHDEYRHPSNAPPSGANPPSPPTRAGHTNKASIFYFTVLQFNSKSDNKYTLKMNFTHPSFIVVTCSTNAPSRYCQSKYDVAGIKRNTRITRNTEEAPSRYRHQILIDDVINSLLRKRTALNTEFITDYSLLGSPHELNTH